MKEFKVIVKNPNGWNTINRRNAELIINNCSFKCNGSYSDDYAYDNEINFGRDEKNESIKTKLSKDPYYKIYWEADNKTFLFFYGHWLSYKGIPNTDFKVIEESPQITQKNDINLIPNELKELVCLMTEALNLSYEYKGYKNIKPDAVNIKIRQKYYALDIGNSGKFLIDKITLSVYTIKAYGVTNRLQGTLTDVKERIKQDIETYKTMIQKGKGIFSIWYIG